MPKRNIIWLIAIVTAGVVAVWVSRSGRNGLDRPGSPPGPVDRAYRLIRENYYRPTEAEAIQRGAVRGMVESLDGFSSYVPANRAPHLDQRIAGVGQGLGLMLKWDRDRLRVLDVEPDSPADRARVRPGFVLNSIDGTPVPPYAPPAALREMLHVESPVKLSFAVGDDERHVVEIEPAEYRVHSVRGLYRGADGRVEYVLDEEDALACVRLTEFVNGTAEDVHQAMRSIPRIDGLVLDLRGNPGGRLPAAVETADLFLRDGPIVSVRRAEGVQEYAAHAGGTYPDFPMVVLVDAETASAAEIVAGALRRGGRAVLVGERTRGKGCIQSMFPLSDGLGWINLTTAEFFFDEDRPITRRGGRLRWGVDPHVTVRMTPVEAERRMRVRLRLWRTGTSGPAATRPSATTRPAGDVADERVALLLDADPQLRAAVELLRSPERMDDILRAAAAEHRPDDALRADGDRDE